MERYCYNPHWVKTAHAHEGAFRCILRLMEVAERGIPIEKLCEKYNEFEFDVWRIDDFRALENGRYLLAWTWLAAKSKDIYAVRKGTAEHVTIVERIEGDGTLAYRTSGPNPPGTPLIPKFPVRFETTGW